MDDAKPGSGRCKARRWSMQKLGGDWPMGLDRAVQKEAQRDAEVRPSGSAVPQHNCDP